jgi:thiol-disulfide isomerase/thioredoxin
MDLDKLYKRLEEKVEEGIALLPRATIGEPQYKALLNDILDTLQVLEDFEKGEQPKTKGEGIQAGDDYMSLDGSQDDRKLVFFSSDGCSFCNLAKPVYLPLLKSMKVPVEMVSLDEKEGNEFAQSLGVSGIPTFLLVKNGKVTYRFQGYDTQLTEEQNITNLKNTIQRYL